jgi:hypothetical protein
MQKSKQRLGFFETPQYIRSDYDGDMDDRMFTTCYVFTLAEGPTRWNSSVQSIVAMLETSAEGPNCC